MIGSLIPKASCPHALQQRDKAAGKKVGAHQIGRMFRRKMERGGDQQGNRDRASIHGENMLEGQGAQRPGFRDAVDRMDVGAIRTHISPNR